MTPDALAARIAAVRAELAPRADAALAERVDLLRLDLHPELAAERERDLAYVANYGKRKARDGRASGWRNGTPQCPSCRRILSQAGGWCPNCQTFEGRHDHGR
jgi:hypothetical protein